MSIFSQINDFAQSIGQSISQSLAKPIKKSVGNNVDNDEADVRTIRENFDIINFNPDPQPEIEEDGKWLQESIDETIGTNLKTDKNLYDGILGSQTREAISKAVNLKKTEEVHKKFRGCTS